MNEPVREAVLAWISADDDLIDEVKELCWSAGYAIVEEVRQVRSEPDPRFYLGSGKIRELTGDYEHLILPHDLTPSQSFSIQTITGLQVVDRIRLILEIFRKGARSPESRIQVELADLQHQLPIVREYVHSGKLSEKPGFMAGGEYRVDYYYQMIRKRMTRLKKELFAISGRREKARVLRRRRGAHIVSLAGYTNAGKSTLLNRLISDPSEEKMGEVSEHVFTTISTSTRKMVGPRNCLVTDTVGFISGLPPWLFEGFMATLEEVFLSDIILLVLDITDPEDELAGKICRALRILSEGGATGRILLVANKIDMIEGGGVDMGELKKMVPEDLSGMIKDHIPISAVTGQGFESLLEMIDDNLPSLLEVELALPSGWKGDALLAEIRKGHPNVEVEYADRGIRCCILTEERWGRSLAKLVEKEGGRASVSGVLAETSGERKPTARQDRNDLE